MLGEFIKFTMFIVVYFEGRLKVDLMVEDGHLDFSSNFTVLNFHPICLFFFFSSTHEYLICN